ncbi:hypothetical protein IIE18_11055 [Pseudomonas sp. V1]|uniref:hypothetical protein n=1 Tax=Pseudomonas arcuscaelestis TaxID=2710591 RepID=UPI0019401DC5|nr:hypothetical protein [Pseudomonas arcuscaelestis]MBM3105678.1 hypothetical protein [Pseudomonas arcuscaelestis]
MNKMPLPAYGAEIEAFGVLTTFVGADVMSDGDIHFTVKTSESNARVIRSKTSAAGHHCSIFAAKLVQVSMQHCQWRRNPCVDVNDEEGYISIHVESHARAAASALKFQRAISRLNK